MRREVRVWKTRGSYWISDGLGHWQALGQVEAGVANYVWGNEEVVAPLDQKPVEKAV